MQLLHEENQKLPFWMLRDCMVCFVLNLKNNMNKKYWAEILTKLVKQK